MNKIEVCYSPALFDLHKNEQAIAVVVDILRATTSICSAFTNGVKALIPVAGESIAADMKKKGYTVAAERDGIKLDFADFGNSPENFSAEAVGGREVVYCTTNGTKTIMLAKDCAHVVIGAFSNITALKKWIEKQQKDVIVLCAGWKNKYNIEDSVFAGALTDMLLQTGKFETDCDSSVSAQDLWLHNKNNLKALIDKSAQKKRLQGNNLDYCIPFCIKFDTTDAIPILKGDRLVEMKNVEMG